MKNNLGVSIVICCHNSAQRLPSTMAHLVQQKVSSNIRWEVMVVDNASIDDTSQIARDCWPETAPAPLRVVYEPQPGLVYARQRGFREAQYEFVSFIDDDNWVSPIWVQTVSEVMSQDPRIGACGGDNQAVFETEPPDWFEKYQTKYAVGKQGDFAGDVTHTRGFLWGAGLTIRKSAWRYLVDNGFHSHLVGRQEGMLTSGEDQELCLALGLAGWRLWYEPCLQLSHFIPERRLDWLYLRRLVRSMAASHVILVIYEGDLQKKGNRSKQWFQQTWWYQSIRILKKLFRKRRKVWLARESPLVGVPEVLIIESYIGKLFELLRLRGRYTRIIQEIRTASWKAKLGAP